MRVLTIFLFVLLSGLFSTDVTASVTPEGETINKRQSQKLDRQEDRLHRKIKKIQNRIIQAKEKAGEAVLDDAGFLADADDRVRWGLVGLAGGIILSLILTSSLKFIGTLAIIGGLGLLIWYLIDP